MVVRLLSVLSPDPRNIFEFYMIILLLSLFYCVYCKIILSGGITAGGVCAVGFTGECEPVL